MTNPSKRILVAGSINMDMVVAAERIPLPGETVSGTNFQTIPGGKGANQAVAIARLGHPAGLIGCVGSDQFGDELLGTLKDNGVAVEAVRRVPGSSGVALITVDSQGQNSIVVTPGANAFPGPEDIDAHRSEIAAAAVVLAQLETSVDTALRLAEICHDEGVPFMLDPAPARDLPPSLLRLVTWFTPNETEAAFYLAQAGTASASDPAATARALRSLGPQNVLLKLRSRGFHLLTQDGIEATQPAFDVRAVDTTAAGDCFNGAFALYLATGHSAVESACFASAAAAVSVTRHGAQSSMPSRHEGDELLRHGSPGRN